jgi:hypothetical protein
MAIITKKAKLEVGIEICSLRFLHPHVFFYGYGLLHQTPSLIQARAFSLGIAIALKTNPSQAQLAHPIARR